MAKELILTDVVEAILMKNRKVQTLGYVLADMASIKIHSTVTPIMIRIAVSELRSRGICIIADRYGYRITYLQPEVDTYIKKRETELKKEKKILRAMKLANPTMASVRV